MQDAVRAVQVDGLEEVLGLAGRGLGPSEWVEITQANVDAFARSVQDWHWAHNDPDRAARGPFETAHRPRPPDAEPDPPPARSRS